MPYRSDTDVGVPHQKRQKKSSNTSQHFSIFQVPGARALFLLLVSAGAKSNIPSSK